MKYRPHIYIIIVLLAVSAYAGEVDDVLIREYKIVETSDQSMKALGGRRLSSYSHDEIAQLPVMVRKEMRIVVPTDITKEELKMTLKQAVIDKTKENPDIDAIIVFAYDREEDSASFFTFGKVVWAPNGNWADVTPEIAANNYRDLYKYKFEIREKVGNIKIGDVPTKREYEIYDYFHLLIDRYPNLSEEKMVELTASKYNITEEEVEAIYLKVDEYNFR